MEDNDSEHRNVIYILAVMLERKRILVERDVQRDEGEITLRIYEHRETGESFLVPDPRLGFDALESLQEEVIAMLGGPRKKKASEEDGEPSDEAENTESDPDATPS
jgi:hypothetical protein